MSALSLSLAVVGLRAQPDGLDLLLINGKVFTANPAAPWAEAVAIRGNRITAVGTTAAIRQTAGAETWLVDVGGRVVIPGINDDFEFRIGSLGRRVLFGRILRVAGNGEHGKQG